MDAVREHLDFYPRPPRGGRQTPETCILWIRLFLPTPSARRATYRARGVAGYNWISTHALREEGDKILQYNASTGNLFLPTPSARRATSLKFAASQSNQFLPTPSARRATPEGAPSGGFLLFLPTPSARRATCVSLACDYIIAFLPTPSARRATPESHPVHKGTKHFYPRPPRGGRRTIRRSSGRPGYFYPRPPRGGRRNTGGQSARLC